MYRVRRGLRDYHCDNSRSSHSLSLAVQYLNSSRHIRVLGQFQINKKITSKQTQQTQQQTFPSFPHNLHFFPTAKPNATYIFVLILANDELFEFCVSCGEFGGNMKVFVEFVLRLIFVDLGCPRTLICLLLTLNLA